MTELQRKALGVIAAQPGIRTGEFSRRMWPDSPNTRNLRKQGWIEHRPAGGYVLTPAGLMALVRAGHQAVKVPDLLQSTRAWASLYREGAGKRPSPELIAAELKRRRKEMKP